jgi:hypothetical protein
LKVILLSAIAGIVIAVAASFVLNHEQEPAYRAFTGSGARVGEPGTNLVGPTWNGLNEQTAPGS